MTQSELLSLNGCEHSLTSNFYKTIAPKIWLNFWSLVSSDDRVISIKGKDVVKRKRDALWSEILSHWPCDRWGQGGEILN